LHVHLVGSVVPAEATTGPFGTFDDFVAAYGATHRLVRTAADVETLTVRLGEQLTATGVRYAEVTVTPLSHLAAGIEADELAEALDRGRRRVHAESGVRLAWIFDVSGDMGVQAGHDTLAWVLRHAPAGTVGFGLAGPEEGVPRALFKNVFERARAEGLHSVPHAGESAGPESVWSALRDLHAERIGHGVQSTHDPSLLEHLAASGTVLEVCLTSNVSTGVVARVDAHPLPRLLDAGVRVTLGTDDPGLFDTDLNREYALAYEALGVSRARLQAMAETSVAAAFAP
jgi:aminodeoxyfutalosine deaminase